jgi:hypothetical protein
MCSCCRRGSRDTSLKSWGSLPAGLVLLLTATVLPLTLINELVADNFCAMNKLEGGAESSPPFGTKTQMQSGVNKKVRAGVDLACHN